MGNTKGLTRGSSPARGGSSVSADPFAELEEMLNADLGIGSRQQAGQRAPQGRRDPSFDSLDLDFQAAFENETGIASAAGRGPAMASRPAMRHPSGSASRPTHLTDEEIDHELEEVLRNLSAPARPRDRIVVETQSFAPERAAEERIIHAPPADIDEFEELIRSELAVIRPNVVPPHRSVRSEQGYEGQAYDAAPDHHGVNYAEGPMEYGRPASPARRWKRRLMATGSVVVLLCLGGAGAYLLNGASTRIGDDEPLLIKADAEPYKIAPKDPGGRAYPNQNKAVYDRVASPKKDEQTPVQKALLKNAEEPMELPTEDEEGAYSDALPGVELASNETEGAKDETRVTPETETDESAAEHVLQPRRVKTMRVGPDGRLMPSEEAVTGDAAPASAKPATGTAALAAKAEPTAPDPVQVASVPVPSIIAPSPRPVSAAAPVAKAVETPAAPIQTASAMPTGGYFVQVASQPTEASAQQSMSNMGSRYASVISGRPMGILAADIPGKGTYYRVRVAAGSKEEAASLCSKLKAAGGSCLVTR